jgi:menaquinone-dependent protoporphyrinogen IX oxidase
MAPTILSDIPKEKQRYIKHYIKEKDWWMVQYFIFTGKFPEEQYDKQIQ